MKPHNLVLLIIVQVKFSFAFYDQFVVSRFGQRDYSLDLSSVNIGDVCNSTATKKCIWKCCPEGQILGRFKTCDNATENLSNITVYDGQMVATKKSLSDNFKLFPGLMNVSRFSENSLWWYKGHLIEDGRLILKFPNMYNEWKEIPTNHFCIDMKKNFTVIPHTGHILPDMTYEVIPVFMVEYHIENHRKPSAYNKMALIVSAICLLLTLIAYALVPQLKDLDGIILMIHFSFLIVMLITHCCLESYNTMHLWMSEILTLTFSYYFLKLCSYCWTNIMFYRLLMSEQSKESPSSSWRKQLAKYCAYAIGVPVLMTIMMATVEMTDMSEIPSFVTPQIQNKGNFSFHEKESLYYLYMPLMIILGFNWTVCFTKVVGFCKTARRFSVVHVEMRNDNTSLNRPMQFVKLLAVLSLLWLLEMLSIKWTKGTHEIASSYMLCFGLIIFVTFVWNKQVRALLAEQIKGYKSGPSNPQTFVAHFQNK